MVLSLTHSFLSISSSVRDHRDEDGVMAVGVEADAEEEEEEEAREPKILSTRTLKLSSMAAAGFKDGKNQGFGKLQFGGLRMRSFWSFDNLTTLFLSLSAFESHSTPAFAVVFLQSLDSTIRRVVLFKPSLIKLRSCDINEILRSRNL